MQESIFRSVIRSFFVAMAAILGILMGIILLFAFVGSLTDKTDGDASIKYDFSPEIKANAQNIRKSLSSTSPVILKVNLQGVIGMENLTRKSFRQQLIESREKTLKDDRVKAILLSIDSPGGTVVDADGIYHALKEYKEQYKVPVYAHVDGMCASGGMYVACATDKIYASKASIIGSIGVIVPSMMNFSKLMDKVGVESLTLSAGKGKDDLNPFRPWKTGEGDNYQELVTSFYDIFVNLVTTNRPEVNREKLIKDYGAKVFPADEAKEVGLIDGSGYTLNETLALLAKDANLEDGKYQVLELKEENWFLSLFTGKQQLGLLKGEVNHRLQLSPELDPKLMNQFLYLYRPE